MWKCNDKYNVFDSHQRDCLGRCAAPLGTAVLLQLESFEEAQKYIAYYIDNWCNAARPLAQIQPITIDTGLPDSSITSSNDNNAKSTRLPQGSASSSTGGAKTSGNAMENRSGFGATLHNEKSTESTPFTAQCTTTASSQQITTEAGSFSTTLNDSIGNMESTPLV